MSNIECVESRRRSSPSVTSIQPAKGAFMRALLHSILFAISLSLSSTAVAVELNYTWKKGDICRYSYEETSHFTTGKAGGPAYGIVTVRSTFAEKVLAVR